MVADVCRRGNEPRGAPGAEALLAPTVDPASIPCTVQPKHQLIHYSMGHGIFTFTMPGWSAVQCDFRISQKWTVCSYVAKDDCNGGVIVA